MTTFETNALEINDLNKNYPGFSLNHLNLTLPSGCILGLIGENGAGKTTTIKLILDIIKKDSGSIRILGRDCTSATTILKEEIGVVLDEVGFQECLTPLQIGRIMKDIFHNWDPSLYDQYLQKFNLPNKKEFGKFSKGMKMKLGIAVALSHHPKLLILDEATSGLDPVMRDEILDIFNDFTRDESHAILISSRRKRPASGKIRYHSMYKGTASGTRSICGHRSQILFLQCRSSGSSRSDSGRI